MSHWRAVSCSSVMRIAAFAAVVFMLENARAAESGRVAVLGVAAKTGIDSGSAAVVSDLIEDCLRNQLKRSVIGKSDIETMLGLEKMKDMLSCEDNTSCMAQIGGALGVTEIVTGSVSKVGSFVVVTLKRIDPRGAAVLGQATDKIKGGSEDDLVEAVAPLVGKLYGLEIVSPAARIASRPPPPAPQTAGGSASSTAVAPAVEAEDSTPSRLTLSPGVLLAPSDSLSFALDAAVEYRLAAGLWVGGLVSLGDYPMKEKADLVAREVNLTDIVVGPTASYRFVLAERKGRPFFELFGGLDVLLGFIGFKGSNGAGSGSTAMANLRLGVRIWYLQLGLSVPLFNLSGGSSSLSSSGASTKVPNGSAHGTMMINPMLRFDL